MKKYLSISAFVILYLGIVYILGNVTRNLWFKGWVPASFANQNYILNVLIAFILVMLVYALIFKLRKKSFIKTCNFSKLSLRDFVTVLVIGVLLGILTSCLCNTSFISKNVPSLEQYLYVQLNGISSFAFFLIVIALIYACEEMIFRGAVFNEVKSGVSLYKAIAISVAVYVIINAITEGVYVAMIACFGALFYNLAYVYMRSLFASIVIQISSIYVIMTFIKTGIWQKLRNLDDIVLFIIMAVILGVIVIIYHSLYCQFNKLNKEKQATITA